MRLAPETLKGINEAQEAKNTEYFRRHLGASIIGKPCMRKLWYTFRWAVPNKNEGRMLRLFERGQLEEKRFTGFLKDIGCKIWTHDDKGKQFRYSFCDGHAGGSLDCVVMGLPELDPKIPCLGECKTHADKYFKQLLKGGVMKTVFEHYIQMQLYMEGFDLPIALYMAVNKNDDHLHLEYVERNFTVTDIYKKRARSVVYGDEAPVRLNESPGWWQCSWCDAKALCHEDAVAAVNCRTCAHSTPMTNADWMCEKYECRTYDHEEYLRTGKLVYCGCDAHVFLPDMLGSSEVKEMSTDGTWVKYTTRNGIIINGPNDTLSKDLTSYKLP